MFRTCLTGRTLTTSFLSIALGSMLIVSGCGNNQVDSATTAAPPAKSAPNTAAAGPALSEKLTFDQLALDSAVKRVPSKQGPVYLHFSYTDEVGKVYKCELPEAQSKGSYLPTEWLTIFKAYRLPEVVKTKAAPKNPLSNAVTDFPFISPRPSANQSEAGSTPDAANEPTSAPPPPASSPY